MNRNFILVSCAAVLAACSGPDERRECRVSADCAQGSYCARTADGNVCWEDAVPPVVSNVTLECVAGANELGCMRDGTLKVTATVTDDQEVGEVTAELNIGTTVAVPMLRTGDLYVAELALAGQSFPAFGRDVVARVHAGDGARNEAASAESNAVAVTRERWAAAVAPGTELSVAAVMDGGSLVIAGASLLRILTADGTALRDPLVLGASALAVPSVGTNGIWIGSGDKKLYFAALDGSVVRDTCATTGSIVQPFTILSASRAAVPSSTNMLTVVDYGAVPVCDGTSVVAVPRAALVAGLDGRVYAASGKYLNAYVVEENGALTPQWEQSADVGDVVESPVAVDGFGNIWTVAVSGTLARTTSAGVTAVVASASLAASGVVVLRDGSVVLGDNSGKLRRFRMEGEVPWPEPVPTLVGTPSTPLVLQASLLLSTSDGWVYDIDSATGTARWSHQLTVARLKSGNVFHQPGDPLPTAYFPSADGKLYAIVVDSGLDPESPWPKAYHDPQNTGNASTPIE